MVLIINEYRTLQIVFNMGNKMLNNTYQKENHSPLRYEDKIKQKMYKFKDVGYYSVILIPK
jgi:hypothetical protein